MRQRRKGPRRRGEHGAALVEFAILLPVFLLIVFDGLTAGIAFSHKSEVIHAVRDDTRYKTTVPLDQCTPISTCANRN